MTGKYDWKSTHRRAHLIGKTVVEIIIQFGGFILAFLRIPFGGKPGPSQWNDISEMTCDLANALIDDETWAPESLKSSYSPCISEPKRSDTTMQFAQARHMTATLPINDKGKADNYIDDMIPVCVNIGNNDERCAAAVDLAIDVLARLLSDQGRMPREFLLSLAKLMGEPPFQEIKNALGWILNKRCLIIVMSDDKLSV
jgi:hypothetical protein